MNCKHHSSQRAWAGLSCRSGQHGFSLIELLVAIAVGLILLTGLAMLFANSSSSGNELDKSLRQMENGRYAMDLLNEELTNAGFYGEAPLASKAASTVITSVTPPPPVQLVLADPCAGGAANPLPANANKTDVQTKLGWSNSPIQAPIPLVGYDPIAASALTCLSNRAPATATSPASMALVIRRLETTLTAVVTPVTPPLPSGIPTMAANTVYVQTSRCADDPTVTGLGAGNVNLIGSATASDMVFHNIESTTVSDCSAASSAGVTPTWSLTAAQNINPVRRYVSRVFYISNCDECGVDTIPTLKRAELVGNQIQVTPLVEGIEEMAVEYGFDTNYDGAPDVFRTGLSGTAGAADNDWSNVVVVRLFLLSRTIDPSPGYNDNGRTYAMGTPGVTLTQLTRGPYSDGFKRRVHIMTIRLTNRAGPRE